MKGAMVRVRNRDQCIDDSLGFGFKIQGLSEDSRDIVKRIQFAGPVPLYGQINIIAAQADEAADGSNDSIHIRDVVLWPPHLGNPLAQPSIQVFSLSWTDS